MRLPKHIAGVIMGITVVCALAGGVAGTATAGADEGGVTVSLYIRPAVAAAVSEAGITVKANTDWALQADVRDGDTAKTEAHNGGPTGSKGAFIAVEGDVESFTLVGN
jgi:hypothetical protein